VDERPGLTAVLIYRPKAALAAGAGLVRELGDRPCGDRSDAGRDPQGHIWSVGQTVKVMTRDAHEAGGARVVHWP